MGPAELVQAQQRRQHFDSHFYCCIRSTCEPVRKFSFGLAILFNIPWPCQCKLEVKGMAPVQKSTYPGRTTWNNWSIQLAPIGFLSGQRMRLTSFIIQKSNGCFGIQVHIAETLESTSHWLEALWVHIFFLESISCLDLLLPLCQLALWSHKQLMCIHTHKMERNGIFIFHYSELTAVAM